MLNGVLCRNGFHRTDGIHEPADSDHARVLAEALGHRRSYASSVLRDNLVGHSSGAIAAMRFAEQYEILGSVLVGAYYTDLGMEKEKLSGYFTRPFDWEKIRTNQKWIALFASTDDPWISIDHPRYMHSKLLCEYHEYNNQGHFGGDYFKPDFPELLCTILNNTKNSREHCK